MQSMRTVIETPTFQKQAEKLWSEYERLAFINWIAANPLAGDVIPGAGGVRKVRWGRSGSRQVWWCAGDLLQSGRTGSGVVGGGVCQGRTRQYASR